MPNNYSGFVSSLLVSIIVVLLSHSVHAQIVNASPYSRYGLGDLQADGFITNRMMGGAGLGMGSHRDINMLNPASYADIEFVSFGSAIRSEFIKLANATASQTDNRTELSYLYVGTPLLKSKLGLVAGLLPFSNVGYNISTRDYVDQVGSVKRIFTGTGGVNQAFLGLGGSPVKGLNIGINTSFLFGTISKTRRLEFPDSSNFFNTRIVNTTRISDINLNYGLQWKLIDTEAKKLTLGVTGSLSDDLAAKRSTLANSYTLLQEILITKDTSFYSPDEKGNISLPMAYGAGIMYEINGIGGKENNQLTFALDLASQDWSTYKAFEETDSLQSSMKLSGGLRYRPDVSAKGNYFKRAQYYTGFKYNKTYLQINNTRLTEYGITFGVGFPVKPSAPNKAFSYANVGVEIGQRGTTDENLIQEQYLRLNIGFTLNDDSWFFKRKYE